MIEKDVWEDGWLTGSNTSILQRRWTASCVAWLDSVYRTGRDGCRQKQTAHCQSSSSYLQTAIYVCSLNNWSAALWDVALQQLWPRSEREVERMQQAFGQSSAQIKLANQREFLSFLFFKGLLTWSICTTGYSLSKALANQCEGVLRKDTQLTQSDCISSENSKRYKHKVHHSFRGMKQMYDTAVLWNPNQSVLSLFLNLFKLKKIILYCGNIKSGLFDGCLKRMFLLWLNLQTRPAGIMQQDLVSQLRDYFVCMLPICQFMKRRTTLKLGHWHSMFAGLYLLIPILIFLYFIFSVHRH